MFYGPILSLPGNDKVFPKKPAVDGGGWGVEKSGEREVTWGGHPSSFVLPQCRPNNQF